MNSLETKQEIDWKDVANRPWRKHDMETGVIVCSDGYAVGRIESRSRTVAQDAANLEAVIVAVNHFAASQAEVARLREALKDVRPLLCYASQCFNASNFTDRHQMGPKFRKGIVLVDDTLAAMTRLKP